MPNGLFCKSCDSRIKVLKNCSPVFFLVSLVREQDDLFLKKYGPYLTVEYRKFPGLPNFGAPAENTKSCFDTASHAVLAPFFAASASAW